MGKVGQASVRVTEKGIEVRMSELETPKYALWAHRCAVLSYGHLLELAYLQQRPGEPERLAASLIVPVADVVTHIWASAEGFYKTVLEAYEKSGVAIEPPAAAAPPYGTAPVLGANVVRMARAGLHGVMDWYYLSPQDMHLAKTAGRGPRFDPVIQIRLPGPSLAGILHHVATHLEEWRKKPL
ncbi:MAG: hypothetical protein HY560_02445 [Gemmatimonadetes bacterium]|nr:hypothetical protein [Gemmatimonadota bacterium]